MDSKTEETKAEKKEASTEVWSLEGKKEEHNEEQKIQALRAKIRGTILQTGQPGYDEARQMFNTGSNKSPTLIIQPRSAGDVIHAINYAKENKLKIVTKAGGHAFNGRSTGGEGTIMLHLNKYLNWVNVDAEEKTAWIGGGCLLKDVDRETTTFGLATPMGTYGKTGVGLALHGGFGYLSPAYGYAVDNILEVEIVTGDGKLERCSKTKNSDLFWGVCGGATHLGAAIQFKTTLYPEPKTAYGGMILWDAKDFKKLVLFHDSNLTKKQNVHFYAFIMYMNFPPLGDPTKHYVTFMFAYTGSDGKGKEYVDEYRALATPLFDKCAPVSYYELQAFLEPMFADPCHCYTSARYLKTSNITEELVDEILKIGSKKPDSVMIALNDVRGDSKNGGKENIGKANCNVSRGQTWELNITSVFPSNIDEKTITQRDIDYKWVKEARDSSFSKFLFHDWNYVNHSNEEDVRTGRTFGPNQERLQKLKAQYDPLNLFPLVP